MTRTVDPALTEIRQMILRMGSLAEGILERAIRVVRDRDVDLASQVKQEDLEIDRLELDLDQKVLEILARQAPVAEDLRHVIAIKSMSMDLERVGDLARNIAQSGSRLAGRAPAAVPASLHALEEETSRQLRNSLDSYSKLDADMARQVIAADDRVDELQDVVVREAIDSIGAQNDAAPQAIDYVLIAESLERVGDHATNLAEDVILIAEAKNVKHAEKLR